MVAVVLRVLSSPEGEVGVVVDEGGEEGGGRIGRPRGRSASEDGRNGRKGDMIVNARARGGCGNEG